MLQRLVLGLLFALLLRAEEGSPFTIPLGPFTLRPVGFLDIIGSTHTGITHDDISTRFGAIPLNPSPVESVVSLRNSRIALEGDLGLAGGKLGGYYETDFLNRPPQEPYRFRQYYGNYVRGGWEILAGQAWSLLRPNRSGISTTSALMNTRAADAGYHVGLLGIRDRQIRVVRRAGAWTAALAWEHGHDFVSKLTHDSKALHLEAIGLLGERGHRGGSLAAVLHTGKRVDLVTQQSWIRQGGREALNAVAANALATASLQGAEIKLTRGMQAYAYYGIVYAARNPGNRSATEWSTGFIQDLPIHLGFSALSLTTQFSHLNRAVWDGRAGNQNLGMVSLRYSFSHLR